MNQLSRSWNLVTLTVWWLSIAEIKWIAGEIFWACANRGVIDDGTQGLEAARAWTRIYTALLVTRFVAWTLGIYCAFRATIWRTTEIIRSTCTGRSTANRMTQRIGTAGRGCARVSRSWFRLRAGY